MKTPKRREISYHKLTDALLLFPISYDNFFDLVATSKHLLVSYPNDWLFVFLTLMRVWPARVVQNTDPTIFSRLGCSRVYVFLFSNYLILEHIQLTKVASISALIQIFIVCLDVYLNLEFYCNFSPCAFSKVPSVVFPSSIRSDEPIKLVTGWWFLDRVETEKALDIVLAANCL